MRGKPFAKGNPFGFKPGQSGNPTGRKPTVEGILALARSHCPDAIQALADALKDPDRAVPAAIALLDRGIGKPAIALWAQVDTTVTLGGIDRPPKESLEQWLERRRRELASLDGPPRPEPVPAESAQPQPSPPNGEPPPNGERAGSAAGSAADSAEPPPREMSEQERDWLNIRRRELGIEQDDVHPNPTWKLKR